jgi:hypothetical protein
MQTLAIPGWIWVNMLLLVAAAIFVKIKLGRTSTTKRRDVSATPERKTVQRDLNTAMK